MNKLILDIETGGLTPGENSILQIGALIINKDNEVVDEFNKFIKLQIYSVEARALKFNKVNLIDVYEKGESINNVIYGLIKFIHNQNSNPITMIGHNPFIDKYFLKYEFSKINLNIDDYIHYRLIDTMSMLYYIHMVNPFLIPKEALSSEGAFKYFNIKNNKPHDALSDCYAIYELFKNIINVKELNI